jgi:hypothetical protein
VSSWNEVEVRDTAAVKAALGVGGLDGLSADEAAMMETFAHGCGFPDLESYVNAFASNHDKRKEEVVAAFHMVVKQARERIDAMAAGKDEGVTTTFDDFLSRRRDSPPPSSTMMPSCPSVSRRAFPPNDEVDAHHMRARQQLQEAEENAGGVLHFQEFGAEKANFREAAGVGLEEMTAVTLVGWCSLTVSKLVLKAPLISALETVML